MLAKFAAPVIVGGCSPIDVARRETAAVADVDLVAGQARLGLPIPAPLARRLLGTMRKWGVGHAARAWRV